MKKEEIVFHKYPRIASVGHKDVQHIFLTPEDEIVIEEKIDGANFRFYIKEDDEVVFGSRGNVIEEDNASQKNFTRCVKFVADKINEQKERYVGSLIFYGECCVKHSYEYDWDKIPPYLGFDVVDLSDGFMFVDYVKKKKFFDFFGLPMVPLIKIVKAKDVEKIDESSVPTSAYSLSQAEGIVFKNYSKQLFAKYVTDKFREVNREAFGGGKKYTKDDSERIVAMYCTNARIDKVIFKLVDEGETLEMALMRFLPKRIIEDIYVEHWGDILNSSFTINMKKVRKLIALRCKSVLNQVSTNNALVKKK